MAKRPNFFKNMPTIWTTMKKACKNCKSSKAALDVHEPTRRRIRSGFCDVIIAQHGRRQRKKQMPPAHDPVAVEFRTTTTRVGCGSAVDEGVAKAASPGTGNAVLNSYVKHSGGCKCGSSFTSLSGMGSSGYMRAICHQCGEHLARKEGVEEHHLSKHAVTELTEVDMSRKIIEKIFKTGWSSSSSMKNKQIERILKVHNRQTTLAQFEEYREIVKIRAYKFPEKHHPRCLADGNELLRFYGTTIACLLGHNGSNGICTLENCNVCDILRRGFSSKKNQDNHHHLGVLTAPSSEGAYRYIDEVNAEDPCRRKALIVCRVIAGRVWMPTDESFQQELGRSPGFDSVAWKLGPCSCLEELYLLSPMAILPCFVIICEP
ncbi:hypothetical protein Dimus_032873 [Dionaea muscipula]